MRLVSCFRDIVQSYASRIPQAFQNPLLLMVELNLLIWNTRGAGSERFLSSLQELVRIYHPSLLVLVETRISGTRADTVCRRIGYDGIIRVDAQGFAGGIWRLWKTDVVSVLPISLHSQHITVEVIRRAEEPWILSAIYASPHQSSRTQLWDDLVQFAFNNNKPWLLAGDEANLSCAKSSNPNMQTK